MATATMKAEVKKPGDCLLRATENRVPRSPVLAYTQAMPHRFLRSASHAIRGFWYVCREERNFRLQLALASLAILATVLLGFSLLEIALVVFAILLVLGAEMLNTLIEDLLNVVEPNKHPVIGKLKDVMAGIVLLHAIGAGIIGAMVLLSHFG